MKHGVLLVNLGTPRSPATGDVRRYLREFLMDERVIDVHPVLRSLLVNGVIAPFRAPRSAAMYRKIWFREGSPLLVYGERLTGMVQERLGEDYLVQLAMRYGIPSIPDGLQVLQRAQVSDLIVVPLFPQYASATVGSVHQRVMREISRWQTIPNLKMISHFYSHPGIIRGFADNARRHRPEQYDHILFSFHGIPQRQLVAADDSGGHCLIRPDCCGSLGPQNHMCYSAQCYAMARLVADQLSLSSERYTVTFQSRLGRTPWTQPYTSQAIRGLGESGARRLLIFSPSFVSDCLETLYEIQVENQEIFREAGGEELTLVESLNDSPAFAETLVDLIRS